MARWLSPQEQLAIVPHNYNEAGCGSARGPVTAPVFKTGGRHLRDVVGVFDSHTLPPKQKT